MWDRVVWFRVGFVVGWGGLQWGLLVWDGWCGLEWDLLV